MTRRHLKLLPAGCVVALLTVLVSIGSAAPPADSGAARAEWMTGFVKLEAADKAVAENNMMAALPLYKEALAIFEEVRRRHPQWNPSLLNYRINYCQQNIEKLESRIQSDAVELSREDLLTLNTKQAKELQGLQNDKRDLTAKVAVLTDSIDRARQEAAKTAGQETALADLAAAKMGLEQKVSLLELRLREALEANARLQGQTQFQEQATRLASELNQAQERNQQLAKETAALRTDKEAAAARLAELTRQLDWLQRQKNDQDTAIKVARELADTRKTENDNLMTRLAGAEAKRELAEKTARDKDQDRQRLQQQNQNLTTEVTELRRFRDLNAENQQAIQNLQLEIVKHQETIAAQQRDLLTARQENATLTARLEAKVQELAQHPRDLTATRPQLDEATTTKLTSAEARLAETEQKTAAREQDNARRRDGNAKNEAGKTAAQTSENIANDLPTLRQNLVILTEQLKTKEAALQRRDAELAMAAGELERNRAQAVIREEKNLELLTATERLKTRLAQAENQNQRLAAQLQEAALVRDKTVDDARSRINQAAEEQKQARQAMADLTEARQRLQEQTDLARRQENQIAELEKNLRDQTEQLTQARQETTRTLDDWNLRLERQTGEIREREQAMARLQMDNKDLQARLADLEKLQAGKLEQLNAQNRLLEQQEKTIAALKQNLDTNAQLDNLQKLADQQIALLRQEKTDLSRRNQDLAQALARQETIVTSLNAAMNALPSQEHVKELKNLLAARDGQLQQQEQLISSLKQPGDQTEQLIRKNLALQQSLAKANQTAAAADDLNQNLRRQADDAATQNRQLREEITRLTLASRSAAAEQTRLQADQLAAATEAAEARQRLLAIQANTSQLQATVAEWQQKHQELARKLAANEEQLETLQKKNKFLVAKTEVVDGMAKTLADATAELKKSQDQLTAAQRQAETMRDRNLDLEQQVQAKEAIIARQQSAQQMPDAWVARLQEVNTRLDKETQRRKALEAALVELEDRKGAASQAATPVRAAAVSADAGADGIQASENRIRHEQERTAMVRGFLRQGLDAERQQKFEAAQWNYQQVLELESDHPFALQRLGIIAANTGNDQDTLRYLQQAFRQNPDDLDTLLALGFAQVRQSQPDWAVSTLGRAVSLYPDNVDAARAYGIALLTMGWTQAAEIQLKKTYQMKPEDPETAFNLAVLLATAKPPRLPEAAKWYQTAVKNGAQPDPGLDAALAPAAEP